MRSIIDLGYNLGLRVMAEGIEDRETAELLAEWGCEYGHCYYCSRPLDPSDLATWLGPRFGWGRESNKTILSRY